MHIKLDHHKSILILLPHYDDEIFCLPLINEIMKNDISLELMFLSDSSGFNSKFNSNKRKLETGKFIRSLFPSKKIKSYDLGIKLQVRDGEIYKSLKELSVYIINHLHIRRYDLIVSPIYEGGHQDHDAAAILNYKLGQEFNIRNLYFLTYRGKDSPPFFSVVKKPKTERNTYIKNSLNINFKILFFPYYYKSQWKTWVGLYLGVILRVILSNKMYLFEGHTLKYHKVKYYYQKRHNLEPDIVRPYLKDFLGDDSY